ncbi:MAG: hypothetical protein EOO61_05865 [Hymenobacter sp.]|nr:MAG: hypothetical protein EOO61_05865 [Hymenobacter sp.]
MNKETEIVFKTTVGNLICQVIKSGDGYVRQQTFSTGLVFEEDYTEEEYQDFLRRMEAFNALSTHNKSVQKSTKQTG